jgi:stearoyl-CoA desaturase (delta-9 desaturase)
MYARAARLVERRVWTKWLMVAFHVLFAVAWFVPGVDFGASVAVWFLLQLGIHIGYHRYFAHASFKTYSWFEFLLACIGCLAFQNGPLWWASMHRRHHRLSDTAGDDHSPTRGFWHAHIGWLCEPGVENIEWPLIRDLCRPIPLWMEQHQRGVHLAYGAVLACVFGWSSLLTFWIVPTVICWHTTFATNSICHLVGSQPLPCQPRGSCQARNNIVVAILNLGEGWHNNHHAHPACAHHGFYRWYQFDVAYIIVLLLARLKIVWAVNKRVIPLIQRPQWSLRSFLERTVTGEKQ